MPIMKAGGIQSVLLDDEAFRRSVEAIRHIVETDGTTGTVRAGTKAYDSHARELMQRARRDPRIVRMIRG